MRLCTYIQPCHFLFYIFYQILRGRSITVYENRIQLAIRLNHNIYTETRANTYLALCLQLICITSINIKACESVVFIFIWGLSPLRTFFCASSTVRFWNGHDSVRREKSYNKIRKRLGIKTFKTKDLKRMQYSKTYSPHYPIIHIVAK